MKESEFRKAIISIFDQHGYEKIFSIAQNSGGWEGWLQCELGDLFANTNIQYNREVPVWDDSTEECDFLFQNGFIAEIKCLGWKRVQKPGETKDYNFSSVMSTWQKFEQKVDEDWDKVSKYKGHGIAIAVVPVFTASDVGFRRGILGSYHAININNTFHLYYKHK